MRNEQFGENGLKFPMFPFTEKRKYFDEYGQSVIEVDDFQFEDTSLANQVNVIQLSFLLFIIILIIIFFFQKGTIGI